MAAGLGFKTFTTGEVLTAANVNGYLMQGILVFASAAARDAAITSPQEGQACYLKDTNQVLTYSGSAWVAVGGGSPLTTKGDLYGFSTVDARIPIGTNNQVLTADSAQALGLKWATPAGGGKVLQVVYGSTATEANSTTASYIDTGLTATITPSSASSKVLVLINQIVGKSGGDTYINVDVFRGSTSITSPSSFLTGYAGSTGSSATNYIGAVSASILDTPATTSATTYKTRILNAAAAGNVYANQFALSTIVLMEIGA